MSKLKLSLVILGIGLVSAVVAGGIGAGMATALVTQFTNDNRFSPSDAPADEEREIASGVLGETRPYIVHLPDFYARDVGESYPVLVVLDARGRAPEAADVARTFARAGFAPGHVVVGVENVPRGRTQDFLPPMDEEVDGTTGGADAFLRFIETELLPEIDSLYRTNDTRLLAGHSFGGVFATYAMVERPGLFDGVFAFSPSLWVEGGAMVDRVDSLLAAGATAPTFYANIGDERGDMRTHVERLDQVLEASAPEAMRWQVDAVEGASHGATPRLGLPAALRLYWQGQ